MSRPWPSDGRLVTAVTAALAVALMAPASSARAGGWPTPAAGTSASGDPEVLFTFDDGPSEKTTPRILDALKAHDVQAAFFWVGWRFDKDNIKARRAVLQRAMHERHIIANHTMTHPELCSLVITEEKAAWEIDESQAILVREAAMPVPWFRTPFGSRCIRHEARLASRGLQHFHWDIDPQEWKTQSAKRTIAVVTAHLKFLRGRAVVLMHDTKVATVVALPKILDWIVVENTRRAKIGARPIRIIGPSQLAAEQLAPGLIGWLDEVAAGGRDSVLTALARSLP